MSKASYNGIRIGVCGLGYWGSNVARNIEQLPGCVLAWCCDVDESRREQLRPRFPAARFAAGLEEMIADDRLDAIAIASPVSTHASLAEAALLAGKHCFVEKPLSRAVSDAERLAALASESDRVLMVGHLLVYHPALVALRGLVDRGELGEVRYLYSQRLNLGKLRADENALWSLGAHDVSAALALAGETPTRVSAHGESYVRDGVEDVAFAHLSFPAGVAAHIHVSWLDPRKERRLTVVGSRRMAIFDDMEPAERKLTVYDKGFDPDAATEGDYVARSGEERHVPLPEREPLRVELEHFLECVRGEAVPRTGGAEGLRVVRVLDALQRSLEADGEATAPAPTGTRV